MRALSVPEAPFLLCISEKWLVKAPSKGFPSFLNLTPSHTTYSGEGNGTPLQYSCLENPMDGGAWQASVHGVAKSQTRLSDFTFTLHFHALEKEMATHSSVLAWRIPGTGSLVGCCLWVTQSRTRLKWLSRHPYDYISLLFKTILFSGLKYLEPETWRVMLLRDQI